MLTWAHSSGVFLMRKAHGHVLGKLGAGLPAPSPQLPASQPSLFKPPKPPCAAQSAEKDSTSTAPASQADDRSHMQAALHPHESAPRLAHMVSIPSLGLCLLVSNCPAMPATLAVDTKCLAACPVGLSLPCKVRPERLAPRRALLVCKHRGPAKGGCVQCQEGFQH